MYNKLFIFSLLLLIIEYTMCQDSDCDFTQDISPGETYYVYNTNYPRNYTPGVQCRWVGHCPDGYRCKLDCSEILLPESPSCSMDRLLISKSGDYQLSTANHYCGRGFVTAVSTGQTISVGLITSEENPGGRFMCQLTAEASSSDPGTCRCGYTKQTRIVGGHETAVNEYPMMVGLVHRDIIQIKCGGVIIHKRYVLTAAHCVENLELTNLAVVVGEHNVDTADSSATKDYRVMDIIVHTQYNSSSYINDIAILVTESEIQFGPLVGPVCLPYKYVDDDMSGDTLTVLGWGTTFIGGPKSNVLLKADLSVMEQDQCRNKFPALGPEQICTYTPGKDACQDDSGGPLLYTDPTTGLVFNIGVVSYGRYCASKGEPGINTRVSEFLSWIEYNTPGTNYCKK